MITIENATALCGEQLKARRVNVLIQDEKIVEVSEKVSKGKRIDARGCIVAPALVNSHVHLGDSVAKDVGDGEPLEKLVKPPNGIKHRVLQETSREDLVHAMQDSMKTMLATGTTTFLDFREGGVEGVEIIKDAVEDVPIRPLFLGRQPSFFEKNVESSKIMEDAQEILKSTHGIGLSGFGEVDDETARIVADCCLKAGKISAVHVAENEKVQRESLKETGATEVERALKAGLQLLIHLTRPLNSDLKRVARSETPVVLCPRSNGILANGIPPLKEMWKLGINLLLGTDNLMFNSPDMFREMEYALKVTRGCYRQYFPPIEVLKMATVNAGQALHLDLGSIQEGKLADVMVVEQLSSDPILSLLNRTESKNIKTLISEGNILYQK
jgi:cytosine/adenosine deaminase-related metal-dependent hydrolase